MEYKVTPEIKIDFDNLTPLALNALKLFRQIEKRYKIFGTMDILIDRRQRKNAEYIILKLEHEDNNSRGGCKIANSSHKIKKNKRG